MNLEMRTGGWQESKGNKLMDIISELISKDEKSAYELAGKIISESHETDKWYGFFDEIVTLLNHKNSLVRNRGLFILAANARWDSENKFERILPTYLSHVTDPNPITARQCVKALSEVGRAKPNLIPDILNALAKADLSGYKDSMRPLIEKDIRETTEELTELSL